MIQFQGKVLSVEDSVRDFYDKDKNGNKLPTTHKARITNIVLLVVKKTKDGTRSVPLICKGFDLPSDFVLPKEGDVWDTPEIVSYQSKFKTVPECGIN